MDSFPDLGQLSEREKDALIGALWAEVQHLRARLMVLERTAAEPAQHAGNSSVPPSKTPKAHTPVRPPRGRREAGVGRAGGGRPLPPEPDQIIVAKAKSCPHCGHDVLDTAQQWHSVYAKIECPPVKPSVTRVEQ